MKHKSAWIRILWSALGALVLVSAVAYYLLFNQLSRIKAPQPVKPPSSDNGGTAEAAVIINWPETEKPEKRKEYINLLLVLQDRKADVPESTEAIVLMSFNSGAGSVKIVFFVPEMYVKASGSGRALYGVYTLGGLKVLKKTFEENFGVYLDGCFETDSESVRKIVDSAGGIDISLSAAEAEAMSKKGGQNHLDGAGTLLFTRIRTSDTVFDKTLRQKKILSQFVSKVSLQGKSEMLKMLNDMLPYIATDMTKEEILNCIYEFAKIGGGKIDGGSYIIPENGGYKSIKVSKASLILPDFSFNRALLKKWVYGN